MIMVVRFLFFNSRIWFRSLSVFFDSFFFFLLDRLTFFSIPKRFSFFDPIFVSFFIISIDLLYRLPYRLPLRPHQRNRYARRLL